jgi:RNA polymerase sigma-70 factor (ECF subfamily)
VGRPFGSWLLRIAHNLLVDQYRARRDCLPLDAVVLPAGDSADPVAIAERSGAVAALQQAMRRLKPHQRAVVALRYFDGLNHHDIARTLQGNENTVRVRLHRALVALREYLHDVEKEN